MLLFPSCTTTVSLDDLQVEELRQRLEEKNKLIEKKTQAAMSTTQDRNKLTQELQELRDHIDIKDRKINVLQRKVRKNFFRCPSLDGPSFHPHHVFLCDLRCSLVLLKIFVIHITTCIPLFFSSSPFFLLHLF